MRLIDADYLKELITDYPEWNKFDKNRAIKTIDNAPSIDNLINAEDFKERINNNEYIYLQANAEDIIDAIDCEITYFKEKQNNG